VTFIINTVLHQGLFLALLPGIEDEEAPTSTIFSHVNHAPAHKNSRKQGTGTMASC
jgi:hypothetical protein